MEPRSVFAGAIRQGPMGVPARQIPEGIPYEEDPIMNMYGTLAQQNQFRKDIPNQTMEEEANEGLVRAAEALGMDPEQLQQILQLGIQGMRQGPRPRGRGMAQ